MLTLRSSEASAAPQRRKILYLAAAALAAFELVVFVLLFTPDVPPLYADYYIHKKTTCLDADVPGTVPPDGEVSFRPEGYAAASRLRVCGWDGPAGNGTHSVGESSRLRLRLGKGSGAWTGSLDIEAVDLPGPAHQRVVVNVNGTEVARSSIEAGRVFELVFPIPAGATAIADTVDIELVYPDAIRPDPIVADTNKRSIKLRGMKITSKASRRPILTSP